jgi:hypothetical protein
MLPRSGRRRKELGLERVWPMLALAFFKDARLQVEACSSRSHAESKGGSDKRESGLEELGKGEERAFRCVREGITASHERW